MNLVEGVNKAIYYLQEKIASKLSSKDYPSGDDEYRPNYVRIEESAIVSEASPSTATDIITASITYGGEDAPYAVAFELGSGEKAGRGKYPIVAKNADALSFYWEKIGAQTLVPKGGGGRTYMAGPNLFIIGKGQVDHPGIKAVPYIVPTIQAEATPIADIIGDEFVAQLDVMLDEVIEKEIEIEIAF